MVLRGSILTQTFYRHMSVRIMCQPKTHQYSQKQELSLKLLKLLKIHCQMPPRKLKLPWQLFYLLERWYDKLDSHNSIVGVCWETRVNPYAQGIRTRARAGVVQSRVYWRTDRQGIRARVQTNIYACAGEIHINWCTDRQVRVGWGTDRQTRRARIWMN